MLISAQYRRLNEQLHADRADYGQGGHRWADSIRALAQSTDCATILDYGCGKRTLERALGFAIANYDPAIAGLDDSPQPADLVVCTDVLEHIEPDYLEAVLDDLQRLCKRTFFATVHTGPAKKVLADGRNAHLIQQPYDWWLPKLAERFVLIEFRNFGIEFCVVARPRDRGAVQ